MLLSMLLPVFETVVAGDAGRHSFAAVRAARPSSTDFPTRTQVRGIGAQKIFQKPRFLIGTEGAV